MTEAVVRCPKCGHDGVIITELLAGDVRLVADQMAKDLQKLEKLKEVSEAVVQARKWHKGAQGVNEEEAAYASSKILDCIDALQKELEWEDG